MNSELINSRINSKLKIEFTQIGKEVGLCQTQTIKILAKTIINHVRIPLAL